MKKLADIIKKGGVAVIRTDTLYGIIADAKNPHAVTRVYKIKNRQPLKPVIVLVADYNQIRSFGIEISSIFEQILSEYWPGKVSIVLPVTDESVDTHYLHKGTHGIAFRIPDDKKLCALLKKIGPVIAPSANKEGKQPARTIQDAEVYFGDDIDFYLDGGEVIDDTPSKLIQITHNIKIKTLRGK